MNKLLSRLFLITILSVVLVVQTTAQATFPVNGVANPQNTVYAFTNATIVKDADNTLSNATLVVNGKNIVALGTNVSIPKDAIVIDCKGKFIYPSFIDLYSDYGIAAPQRSSAGGFNPFSTPQITSDKKGPVGWNQALKPEINGVELFSASDKDATSLRESGFGTVLTHQRDGIARGTGTLVTLASQPDNFVVLKDKASAHYSFMRGTSGQTYPSSLMGVIALIRQTYLDANWYKSAPAAEGLNLSLLAWNNIQSLPQVFEANDKWASIRANNIGKEFGIKYIIKGGGNEYQRLKEMTDMKVPFILPLNFPQGMDVDDPNDARYVALADMKHWEMAPTNPGAFEKANIKFTLTTDGLKDSRTFWTNIRIAIGEGLSEKAALIALTKTPAELMNVYDMVGSLETGKLANFIITSKPVFDEKAVVLQNWIQGEKYGIKEDAWSPVAATYKLVMTAQNGATTNYTLDVKSANQATLIGKDSLATKFSYDGKLVSINFSPVAPPKRTPGRRPDAGRDSLNLQLPPVKKDSVVAKTGDDQMPPDQRREGLERAAASRNMPAAPTSGPTIRLSGVSNGDVWNGNGVDTSGNMLYWTATLIKETPADEKKDVATKKESKIEGKVTYPFGAYGWESKPVQKDILIKNATVWTSEKEGILQNTDVLVKNGKIASIGKNLSAGSATVIDGTGKHLTPGIIDEHSHIAVFSINEGGQAVTSEVRIGDNMNPEDINIYRQLSGGVTTSQILHGSANVIGGQSQLIKLRWGGNDEEIKFEGADPFIKFALGENVKRTTSRTNNRFPNTRMGVEEVLMDAFTRASNYERDMKAYANRPKNSNMAPVRRDLELDALVEIMNSKRFITCHSYVQSEITSAMRVAEKFNFNFNTFTHILEGYKVADKMKKHGANASTFSDWFAYKLEVADAIAQNASIMHKVGLNVAINSDDAEMARRLNQEAAKSIKFGLSEEEALKMVTINPATMLHVNNRVGSIKTGKDADLVLWNNNPLSIYAIAQYTMVDGIVYFDRQHDLKLREEAQQERNRLIQKLSGEKRGGASMARPVPAEDFTHYCENGEDEEGHIDHNIVDIINSFMK